MKKTYILLISILCTLMCVFPPIAATGQGTISNEMIDTTDNQILILPDDSTLDLGKTTQITILLNTAPDGLSGYNLTVRVTNPEVAEIISVQFPSWAMLPTNSTIPADLVWCKAADLTGASGTANITLVTVTVRGDSAGATNITVLPDRVEDRQGGRYTPGIQEARLIVGTAPIPPVANFTATPTNGTAPLTVQFTDTSTGVPTAWLWNFGDNTTSDNQNPSHTYSSAGTYTVSLTVTNDDGTDTVTKQEYITVDSPVQQDTQITILPSTSSLTTGQTHEYAVILDTALDGLSGYNLTVRLTNPAVAEIVGVQFPSWAMLPTNSSIPADLVWCKAADLTGASGIVNITLVTVTVRGDSAGITNITVVPDRVEDRQGGRYTPGIQEARLTVGTAPIPPVANFTATPTSGKVPLTVNFTDLSTGVPIEWLWDFGDGTNSTEQHPVKRYEDVGIYTVTLTATNAGGSNTSTKVDYITVTPLISETEKKIVADTVLDVPQGHVVPVGIYGHNMTYLDAFSIDVTYDPTVMVVRSENTAYRPNGWTIISNTATAGNVRVVGFASTPTGSLIGNRSLFGLNCEALTDDGSSTELNLTIREVYEYGANASSEYEAVNGFFQTRDGSVMPLPVAAFTASPTNGTAPLTVNFTDQSTEDPTSWLWNFGDNTTSDDQNPAHTYTSAGTYTVTLTVTNDDGTDTVTKQDYITVDSPVQQDTQITILPSTSSLTTGQTHEYAVILDTAPDGLSGYNLTVRLTNPEVAEIVGVQFPSWAMLPTNSSIPADLVWCKAADLTGASGIVNITLVTVTVRGDSAGITNITVIPDRVEDRQGGRYTPGIQEARLIVGTAPIPPVANFTATPTSGKVPLTVNFTDQSAENPSSWLWSFGDNKTSDLQSPSHTYTSAGIYTVTLTVTNDDGSDTETKQDYITVDPLVPPVANFTATPTSGKVPLTVNFTDQSAENAASWLWNFGDNTTSDDQNPLHTYSSAGTYTISLTVTNDDGSNTEIKENYITVDPLAPPVANFTAIPTFGKVPLTVNFTDQSAENAASWLWNFGDNTTSDKQNPAHTYSSAGNYTISLTVTNDDGTDTLTKQDYITVDPLVPPVANFTATPTTGKIPLSVNFTDRSAENPVSWLWNFGDNTTSDNQHPSHTYSSAGIYTVTLTVTNDDGTDTLTKQDCITVNPLVPPVANFTATPTSGKVPLTVNFTDQSADTPSSWLWSFGDNKTSDLQNPAHTYTSAGIYTVTLNVTNDDGSDSLVKEGCITVMPPAPVINFTGYPTSGFVPLQVQFNATNTGGEVDTWFWSFGDGTTSTDQNLSYSYTNPGTYTVGLIATNAGGNDTEIKTDHISVHLRADFNRNGRIDIGDVAKVAWMAAKLIPEDLEADFNGNEEVDAADAARIAYYYVGKIPAL